MPRFLIAKAILALIVALTIMSFFFLTPAHAQRIGHTPLNVYGPFAAPTPHKINPLITVIDLHHTGVATADLEARSWSMYITCSNEGQVGVLVRDNQAKQIPVQRANCDGHMHSLGNYSSTGLFTFQVVSHARSVHFLVTTH